METLFLVCALVGATLIACQFLLGLLGLGGHEFSHDASHDFSHDAGSHDASHGDDGNDAGHGHGSAWLFSWLTFRTVSAALAFFGLTGLSARLFDLDEGPTLLLALAAGFGALVAVGWMMRTLSRLNADGTARIERAVGSRGTVYLSIPGPNAGAGKVQLRSQHRLLEYKAVAAEPLATGTKIVVVRVVSGDTVEVAPEPERVSHA
jgi:membrane protein implicated in regulation of membrane protease activity